MAASTIGLFYLLVIANNFSWTSGKSVFGKFDPELSLTEEIKDYTKEIWCYKTSYLDACEDLFDMQACFVDTMQSKLNWNKPKNTRQHDIAKQKLRDLFEVISCDVNDAFTNPDVRGNSYINSIVLVLVFSFLLSCVFVVRFIQLRIKKGKCDFFKRIEDMF